MLLTWWSVISRPKLPASKCPHTGVLSRTKEEEIEQVEGALAALSILERKPCPWNVRAFLRLLRGALEPTFSRVFSLTAPSIGRADFQQHNQFKDAGRRNREENSVLPERCGIRMNKFAAVQTLGANTPTIFRDLKSAESSPWQSLVPRELFLPATRSLSRCCLDSGVSSLVWIPNMERYDGVCSDFFDLFQVPEFLP